MAKRGAKCFIVKYPGYLALKDESNFIFKYKEELYLLKIFKHGKSLNLKDFDNSIENGTFTKKFPKKLSANSRLVREKETKNRFKYFDHKEKRVYHESYYTDIIIMREVDYLDSPELYEDTEKLEFNTNDLFEVLNYFIMIYKSLSNDHNLILPESIKAVGTLIFFGFYEYSEEELKQPKKERLKKDKTFSSYYNQLDFHMIESNLNKEPSLNFDKVFYSLNNNLQKEIKLDESLIFLLELENKLNFHNSNDFKFLFLELFIYVEIKVTAIVKKFKLKNGVSKTKYEKFDKDIPISYKLNVELPIIMQPIDEKGKELLGKINTIRSKRNDIVHNGISINREEFNEAYKTVWNFLRLLTEKKLI